jgi:hypothetical protein
MAHLAPRRRATTITAAVVAVPLLAGLAWLTLAPQRLEQRHPGFVHDALQRLGEIFGTAWGHLGPADVLANTVVFVPIGILAYLIIPRRAWFAALLVGPVMSTAIELSQRFFLPERDPSLHDVAAATIGATIGVGLAALCTFLTAARVPSQ